MKNFILTLAISLLLFSSCKEDITNSEESQKKIQLDRLKNSYSKLIINIKKVPLDVWVYSYDDSTLIGIDNGQNDTLNYTNTFEFNILNINDLSSKTVSYVKHFQDTLNDRVKERIDTIKFNLDLNNFRIQDFYVSTIEKVYGHHLGKDSTIILDCRSNVIGFALMNFQINQDSSITSLYSSTNLNNIGLVLDEGKGSHSQTNNMANSQRTIKYRIDDSSQIEIILK